MQRRLKWIAVLSTLGMLLVLLGGALVTKTDSGMGCGRTWPLCNGEFVPTQIDAALAIELAHRLVSGSVGILILLLSVWSWKKIGHIREAKFLSILAFFFLLLQGLIGAAAVKWGQSDFVLALHFGISLISFAAVFLLTLLIFEVDKKFRAEKVIIDNKMKLHIYGIIIYTFFVVYSGALVRHLKASLVCPDWPMCVNGDFGLPANMYQWVQMGHRTAAGFIFIWVLYAAYLAFKEYKSQKVIVWSWFIASILATLQVTSGAFIIVSRLNLIVALAHALFISCLFGVFSYLALLASRSRKNARMIEASNMDDERKITAI
ncbi:cytochrome c oxidase assembly protein subunit 15 [Peribacillus deserti]|uniref:Heme A synthase n=1 Tax=Peribacillus deserti TaxID=673318 RepID=A0ABS2QGY2_9BACI|nr:heme A synthase [Peribacillus deserti]MBM7692407.1 cytochrome c oxidase assembly protein subunit 15 [Peribacillus deserti]